MELTLTTDITTNGYSPKFTDSAKLKKPFTLVCFSHLRWEFVYQRPQHLMSKFSSNYNIVYIEEPIYTDDKLPLLSVKHLKDNIQILLPTIPKNFPKDQENKALENLLNIFITTNDHNIKISWYYTPMMFQWSKFLSTEVIIYDCMDELSAFKFAPPELKTNEQKILENADLIFTGGVSLYKAKNSRHRAVHLFPSSVDVAHFKKARSNLACPTDQIKVLAPCIGFYGVIDERFNINLLNNLAKSRPDWNFVIIGPVVKISAEELPRLPNIHYLGAKTYEELPYYLSIWDIAFIPFVINESTRFISPTKTPEYLAGGKVVVSTPIVDVIDTYGDSEIVYIADPDNIPNFIAVIESALEVSKSRDFIYETADALLNNMSWDKTSKDMHDLILNIDKKKGLHENQI